MIVNWVRIAGIIIIAHMTDMQTSLIEDHNMFGWYLYIPFLVFFFWYASRLEQNASSLEDKYQVVGQSRGGAPRAIWSTVVVLLSVFVFSTAAAFAASRPNISLVDAAPVFPADQLHPQFPSPSSIETDVASIDGFDFAGFRIGFLGKDDANKASYYLNDMVPNGYRALERKRQNNRNLVLVRDQQGNFAIVAFAFGFGTEETASRSAYKILRLKMAALLDRSSSVTWLAYRCHSEKECRQTYDDLARSRPNG
jgi:hypothetical protein